MGIKRLTRVNELLKREVADVLSRVMAEDIADRPLITVTRVETSPDLRRAHVFLSVMGPAAAGTEALSAVYHQRKEIQHLVNKHLTLKYTPRLSFRLDDSLQQGDRVLALLEELDTPDAPDETPDDAPPSQTPPNPEPSTAPPPSLDGLLLVDKPSDWTSHDVVAKLRGHLRIKKVGHGGTLDPMATGLLIVLLGRGTKLSEQVMGSDKVYEGILALGSATNTQDREGEVTDEGDPSDITRQALEEAARGFVGDLMQVPPMVSAVKIGGVPLYKLARKGKTVERKPRLRHVYEFAIRDFRPPLADFRIRCTKGTYVRTLCHELGIQLGCFAHLHSLRRTASGRLSVDDALALDKILTMTREEVRQHLLPLHQATNLAGA